MCRWRVAGIAAFVVLPFLGSPLLAQQQAPAPGAPQQAPITWEGLPRMQLEQMFAGPLQDTVIQRWRDPQTGTVCYLYLPFTVQHGPQTATGSVQYGPNTIGSISCSESVAPRVATPAAAAKKPPVHSSPHPGEASGQQ